LKQFEYFQETAESIIDDSWIATLYKHGNEGWELCSVILQNTYKKQKDQNIDPMQTIYVVTFKREL